MDFDELLKKVGQVARKQSSYDWDKIVDWLRTSKNVVTVREIAMRAGVKHRQLAYQWAERHIHTIVDLGSRKRRVVDEDEFLVKIIKGKSVFYAHIDAVK